MADEPTKASAALDATAIAMLSKLSEKDREAAILHLAAVGGVAAAWAGFETIIDATTLDLGRIPYEPGLCLTAQVLGTARKLDAYISIARLRGGDKFMDQLDTFAKKTVILGERRNRIVHDPWLIISGAGGLERSRVGWNR